MKLVQLSVKDFLNEVDAPIPAPGGGSVSALGVALGISLIRMVGQLTMTKKKYSLLDEKIKKDFFERVNKLEVLKNEALLLVDRDTEAYNVIMKAYQLRKETSEEIQIRNQTIEQATIKATQVPFETATVAYETLQLSLPLFANIVKSAGSDFGVGLMMIEAGLIGASLNVKTNMSSFSIPEVAKDYLAKVNELEQKGKAFAQEGLNWVNQLWK
jgi:formiminotetrahydrofolate cyclodeaminase